MRAHVAACAAACLLLTACASDPSTLPAPDYELFRSEVYPVLLRDCGMSNCHGDEERFFVVWGPGRTRLPVDPAELDEEDAAPSPFDPPTEDEMWLSYQRARAALVHGGEGLEEAPLLVKPLEGRGHGGKDRWDRNPWSREDARWQLVRGWAAGESTFDGGPQP